jgi:alpha-beta hydrolase superfamily lysophospholipase
MNSAPNAPQPAESLDIRSATDGLTLHSRWHEGVDARGVLVVSHGLGDHSGRYSALATAVTSRPGMVDFLAFDQRGNGLSTGKRGVVRSYDDHVGDLQGAVEFAKKRKPGRPIFVLGHSNGGQIALRLNKRDPKCFNGLVLSNPALKIQAPVAPWQWLVGRFLSRVAPWVTLNGAVPANWLTRDPKAQAAYRADPLKHTRIQPRLFFELIRGGESILETLRSLEIPVYLIVGAADPVIDPNATIEWFNKLQAPAKQIDLRPEGVHEPLFDDDGSQIVERLGVWLTDRLNDNVSRKP